MNKTINHDKSEKKIKSSKIFNVTFCIFFDELIDVFLLILNEYNVII